MELQKYLQNLEWETKTFTSHELETKLAAAMIRYLGGRATIDFVLGFAHAIRQKLPIKKMHNKLQSALNILDIVAEKLSQELPNRRLIPECVNLAQHKITERDYLFLSQQA